ncbi:DsbA family oxidoreductase [Thalassotalea agarivorans]|uniref:Predicted dithiol-disulfide isomerase, DsbA family n=1 Tax=Thalassotalea agarivorans TaxID=349064 RepID=A0A1I0EV37_THASX|nr:DsbA family protein [Thalassotalea agarivorans]SET49443.1 Predicted dithiol-disulfide isomerase, DsbA family [Thalassotalea agarivorans]
MSQPLVVDYYSDVLCVWAWIAQRRVDELEKQFFDKIVIKHKYVDIFGDVAAKMETTWATRGGYAGFAEHVVTASKPYDEAPVKADIWQQVKPTTSTNAHLFIKAAQLQIGQRKSAEYAFAIRNAFFVEGLDISQYKVLAEIASTIGLDSQLLVYAVENGTAIAALMSDYQQAKKEQLKGSPTYVLDGGRQTLFGNVGYRVLHANVEQLLHNPENEASWC